MRYPDGITTAIVGFIFVCIVMPQLIKNHHQYYMALAVVLVGMLLRALGIMIGSQGVDRAFGAIGILLDAGAVLLLVMATGGLTARQLAGDMARAYEVMRRGETETTTIIPLPGQKGKAAEDEEPRQRYAIDEPAAAKKDSGGSLPLE